MTLAWLSPIDAGRQKHRKAKLWFTHDGKKELHVSPRGAEYRMAQKGTVQHEVREGEQASLFTTDHLDIRVNCKPDASELREPIPYALAVSLEVREGVALPLYEEVRVGLRAQVPVMVPA